MIEFRAVLAVMGAPDKTGRVFASVSEGRWRMPRPVLGYRPDAGSAVLGEVTSLWIARGDDGTPVVAASGSLDGEDPDTAANIALLRSGLCVLAPMWEFTEAALGGACAFALEALVVDWSVDRPWPQVAVSFPELD